MLIMGSEGFRFLGIVYTVKTLVLEYDFLFFTENEDQKLPNNLKNSPAVHNFSKIIKSECQATKSSFLPNKHIFVRAKKVCLL